MKTVSDLTGMRFGELVVTGRSERSAQGAVLWSCLCDCGVARDVTTGTLNAGRAKTCGGHTSAQALASAKAVCEGRRKYPNGYGAPSRLYKIWRGMRARCLDQKHKSYSRYGASGVTVCEEWGVYEVFRTWAIANGYQHHLTLDREDNDKGYGPDNCRWATRLEQSRNRKRPTRELVAFGEVKVLADWAADPRCVISAGALLHRVQAGESVESAMVRASRSRKTPKRMTP